MANLSHADFLSAENSLKAQPLDIFVLRKR